VEPLPDKILNRACPRPKKKKKKPTSGVSSNELARQTVGEKVEQEPSKHST
jgi:hypothetical protein